MSSKVLKFDNLNALKTQIRDYPMLPEWLERKFFDDYKTNQDLEAKDMLILSNLRLVLYVIKNISYPNEIKEDIIQEGVMALQLAVDKFDYTRGVKFSTYAYKCIEWAIKKYILLEKKHLNLSKNEKIKLDKLIEAKEKLTNQNNEQPTEQQLVDYLKDSGIDIQEIRRIEFNFNSIFQTDEQLDQAESKQSLDFAEVNLKEELETQSYNEILLKEINNLSEPEANIIRLKYGLDGSKPMTLQQIANIYNRSKERIRQILAKALFKLERKLNRKIQ